MDYIENSLPPAIEAKIAENSVNNVTETIQAINSTLDYLNNKAGTNSQDILTLQNELADIKSSMVEMENTIKNIQNVDTKELTQAMQALQDRVNALEENVSVLTKDVSELKDSVASIAQRVTTLETSIANLRNYVEEQFTALCGRIDLNASSIADLTETASGMKTSLDSIKNGYQTLTTAYEMLSARYDSLEAEGNTTREDLAVLKQQLDSMHKSIGGILEGDYGELVDAYNEYTKTIAALRAAADGGSASFSSIFLKEGEKLICSGLPGDTMELIVRRGNVVVSSPLATQGFLDITDSVELLNGKSVPVYHYVMLAGGSDGRGIVSVSGDAWILVRGEYEIG
jgi:peptidoglycan hydrolase CwlO-like protein